LHLQSTGDAQIRLDSMTMYRVQASLPYLSGLPEDVITNTTHWEVDGTWGSTQDSAIVAVLETYYESIYGIDDTFAMRATWLSNDLIIRVFESNPVLSPNPPVFATQTVISATGTAGNGPPAEVAVVTSQFSALLPGARLGRYFNRHYLGGFTNRVFDATTNPDAPPVIREVIRERFADAAALMASSVTGDMTWVIGRQSSGTWVPVEMVGGFVGDEPDTQRRRGVRQQVRTGWTL
jgi:hypothetical protein